MALNFPSTSGEPTDGSFRTLQATTLGDVLYAWSGVYWHAIGTIELGDLANVSVIDGESQDVLVYNGEAWANEADVNGGSF
jgi:hypothetical protein